MMTRKKAIITLAMGSAFYYRMALALMMSAQRRAGDGYQYIIFSDVDSLHGLQVPPWLTVTKLSSRYNSPAHGVTSRSEGFRIKSMILSDETLTNFDVLFLDADCFVFDNCFDRLFEQIRNNSIAIYGGYAADGQLWGRFDFVSAASKAGYSVRNMWLNSGFIGRAGDALGLRFANFYRSLMDSYPFRPFTESRFWQTADEPYLATAYQLAMLEVWQELPDNIPGPSSNEFATTYQAVIDKKTRYRPVLHSRYLNASYSPSIVHFLGGMNENYYRGLVNETVRFTWQGLLLRPLHRSRHIAHRVRYYLRRMFDWKIKELRDV
jgi:hypothetical protein